MSNSQAPLSLLNKAEDWTDTLGRLPRSLIERAYFSDGLPSDAITQFTGLQDVCDACGAQNSLSPHLAAYRARYPESSLYDDTIIARLRCRTCHTKGSLSRSFGTQYGGILPAWGTLWTFHDDTDTTWASNHLDLMDTFGFVVYETDDLDLLLGIDGAGYDFVSRHFLPLYAAMFPEHLISCR